MNKEVFRNVKEPSGHSIIYKSANKGQSSFRITKKLLTGLWTKVRKINNGGKLIITIPDNQKENYVLTCYLTKQKS